jgi:hypothetical protein
MSEPILAAELIPAVIEDFLQAVAKAQYDKPAVCMEEFQACTRENNQLTAIDWHTPDEDLMAKEAELGLDADDSTNPDTLALLKIPPDALKVLLRFLLPPGKTGKARWRIATLKLATLANAAGVDEIGNMRLADIARELDVSRALVSLYSLRLVDELGMNKVAAGKRRETRETFRRTALEAHRRAGHAHHAAKERKPFSA